MLALLMIQNEFIIVIRNVFSSYVVIFQKFRKMSRRRRRADFIDSLNSFQHCETDPDTFSSMSQDSLNEIQSKDKSNHASDNITCNNKDSPILAGSFSKLSCIQNPSINSSSIIHPTSNLNKCIDLFQDEQLCVKTDNNKENNNPQNFTNNTSNKLSSAVKKQTTDLHPKLQSNAMCKNLRRDTNYNVNSNRLNASSILDNACNTKLIPPFVSPHCTDGNKQNFSRNYEDEHVDIGTKKFETMLCLLDNYFNQAQEVSQTQQILKRLSDKFEQSPKTFTEKLLTIIEESVMYDDDDANKTSAINLSRLTTEFRKMCKFIEDESAPEWPSFQMSTLTHPEASISPACNRSIHITNCKNEKLCSPINTSLCTTPVSGIDVIKRRFFAKISKCNSSKSINNVDNASSTSFEHLEDQCNRMFPKEKECSARLHKISSLPSLLSMSHIHNICEQQMASLNVSDDVSPQKNRALSTPNLLDKCQSPSINKTDLNCSKLKELYNKSQGNQCSDISYSKKKTKRINEKPVLNMVTPDKVNSYTILDLDELDKSLIQDIAEKRKRCLNTARIITEINADPEIIEIQKTLRMSPMFANDSESNSLNDETKFLQTLVSCKDYQMCLEKHKSLLKILENSNFVSESNLKKTEDADPKYEKNIVSKKETVNIKKTSSGTKFNLSPNVKSPLLKKQGMQEKEIQESVKTKLFTTPGKSPLNKSCRKKKTYFPDMNTPVQNTKVRHILKSPHAEGLYRLNYNTIMSPVGMYIRGTDMQLIKNVHAKTDNLLLTPVKQNTKSLSNRNSKQNASSKTINKTQKTTALKINLSPRINTNEQEIRNSKSPKHGIRVKKLLETAQSKVVIRHEARINSAQKGKNAANNGMYEINYEPEDESIHVEEAARKTNFINNWRNA
ncbi:probable serine/threonine-protein kinase DDB_G0282963 isoform X2 [Bombus pyrosoma]|uniref:probable serine/threonine-protein kinase DDB_G0282963 isoform X2 n=1 Tax=Bombus pyrosoma TaxID=396416 RepID=UPI001CB8A726|nr:probable serine/threonine-protein kinase DDB_G0282963 isoform X2 [Bombus pyrosoma]